MRPSVWVVLTADDRQLLEICSTEEHAVELARSMDAISEKWPVSNSIRVNAWARALESYAAAREVSRGHMD